GVAIAERDHEVTIGLLHDVIEQRSRISHPADAAAQAVRIVAAPCALLVRALREAVDPGIPASHAISLDRSVAICALVAAAALVGEALIDNLGAEGSGGRVELVDVSRQLAHVLIGLTGADPADVTGLQANPG